MAAFFCPSKPRPNRQTAFYALFIPAVFLYPPPVLFILTTIFIFALPTPACPARSLPQFTYTGFLLSPLRLHQPPKRFQTNIPPSTACLCLPSPAGLHISAAPLFSYPVFLSLHCYQLRLKPLCHQVRPVRTCPVRASPHLTQRKTLFPLLTYPPNAARHLPSPAGLHIPAPPYFPLFSATFPCPNALKPICRQTPLIACGAATAPA